MTLSLPLTPPPCPHAPKVPRREEPWGTRHLFCRYTALSVGFPTPTLPIPTLIIVCLLSHSNRGERKSCGSSRRGSSAGTMRSKCAGRRSGGVRSTSRYGRMGTHCALVSPCPGHLWDVGHLLWMTQVRFSLFSPVQQVKRTALAMAIHSASIPPHASVS